MNKCTTEFIRFTNWGSLVKCLNIAIAVRTIKGGYKKRGTYRITISNRIEYFFLGKTENDRPILKKVHENVITANGSHSHK